MSEVSVIGSGTIPKEDIPFLLEQGESAVFGPGTFVKNIANYIRGRIEEAPNATQN